MHKRSTVDELKAGFQSFGVKSKTAKAVVQVLGILAVFVTLMAGFFYFAPVYSFTTYTPAQPLPYSHKLHAGDLGINCQFCHIYARKSEMAGAPPVSKCMGCHANIGTDGKSIKNPKALEELAKYFNDGKPIPWVRVYSLPDHVWFSHKRHIAKGVDCKVCHGAVDTMEVTAKAVNHKMGFCLNCHQQKEAPTDCWTCHT